MVSNSPAQRGHCRRSPCKRLPLSCPQPTSSDAVILKSMFNYSDFNSSLHTPIPSSHKCKPPLHTELWQHFTTAFARKLNGFSGAFNQTLHSSNSDNSLISLTRELKTCSGRLRRIFPKHGRFVSNQDVLRHNPLSISDDSSIFSRTAISEPTLIRAVFADTFEAPPTRLPVLNGTISKPRDTARDSLRNLLLRDPLSRGQEYLRRNAGNLYSQTSQGIKPGDPLELLENFSQLLILETTNDP